MLFFLLYTKLRLLRELEHRTKQNHTAGTWWEAGTYSIVIEFTFLANLQGYNLFTIVVVFIDVLAK